VAAGVLAESVLSALLAPIRMLFHAQFVAGALAGGAAAWRSPPRDDAETGWGEALRRHGLHSLIGIVWAGAVYWLNPGFAWWLAPITGALALSIPISVLSSHVSLGARARRARLFLIPEEARPPRELRWAWAGRRGARPLPGFVEAMFDPGVNALVRAAARGRDRVRPDRELLLEQALEHGPRTLHPAERNALLGDRHALGRLHTRLTAARS
jgi:membrane glycosyltransferase